MSSLRDLLSVLLLTAATLLGALWLPGAWIERNVVDQEGFLSITQPLAEDATLQRSLTDSAVDEALDHELVPGVVADRATPLLQEQAPKLTGTEAYTEVWDRAMVELHGALFTPGASPLDVDLLPLIDSLLTGVEDTLPLIDDLPRPGEASVTLASIPDVPLLHRATVLDPWAHRTGPIALGLAVLAVLVAGHRRLMLTLAGIGAVLAGLATWLLTTRIEGLVPDAVDQAVFLGPIVQVFEQRFAAEVMPQGVIMLGAGALVAAAGLVLIGLRRSS
ncbi:MULTISPECIES: hypothetical protein [Brachybacterium]|uniref:Uncharacterized protein n=2 Tax=Brachybacterium TaxID=43668 RepID=A0A426SPM3_9MICO|nr:MULTISPECIES: hypothetical protein [Brachybacterium]RRR20267.1 hypothetical protein DS079_02380 [Brachybacterium paraconglomeratum]GLI32140.1 hypothetical protein BCONGLO52_29810 [Brachybacterium conglomeratum]GLK03674.1 hypothetical protein GCM10017597_04730 [Brachybacterium conglomeratum]